MNVFDVFVGMLARDWFRERQERNRRSQAYLDEEKAFNAKWRQFEADALGVLYAGYNDILSRTDALIDRGDLTGYLDAWAEWGTQVEPVLMRLEARCRAVQLPAFVSEGGWDVRQEAAAALRRVADGARLWQKRSWKTASTVTQQGMDMWSVMSEKKLDQLNPAAREAWERMYQREERRARDQLAGQGIEEPTQEQLTRAMGDLHHIPRDG
jgi:hypothetical protein